MHDRGVVELLRNMRLPHRRYRSATPRCGARDHRATASAGRLLSQERHRAGGWHGSAFSLKKFPVFDLTSNVHKLRAAAVSISSGYPGFGLPPPRTVGPTTDILLLMLLSFGRSAGLLSWRIYPLPQATRGLHTRTTSGARAARLCAAGCCISRSPSGVPL